MQYDDNEMKRDSKVINEGNWNSKVNFFSS